MLSWEQPWWFPVRTIGCQPVPHGELGLSQARLDEAVDESAMTDDTTPNEDSPAVHTHLSIMQAVIARMAEGSRSCKTWCVVIVAAILVLGAGMTEFDHLWIAYVPLILFLGLDMYYLALERRFRVSYNAFLQRLRGGDVAAGDLFEVRPAGSAARSWIAALGSLSIGPFYLVLAGVIAFVWWQIGG